MMGEEAVVRMSSSSACAKCGGCLMGGGGGVAEVRAVNQCGAREGDDVELEMGASGVIWASFLVFIVPVLSIMAGYFLGHGLFGSEIPAISLSIAFLAISFLFLWVYDRRLRKKRACNARIVKVLN